jgi:integrase
MRAVFDREIRTIPLTGRACGALGRLWKRGKLFEGVATDQIIMRRHKELCNRLGFDFRLYDFRHTYGSLMAMAGVDLMTLKELMGHSSITLTQRYCHPTPEHKFQRWNVWRRTTRREPQKSHSPKLRRSDDCP